MLEVVDLVLKLVIAIDLTYCTYEYIRCKHLYSKFKSLYSKTTELQKILNDPTPAPPASAETTNYKDRLCGVVCISDSKKYLGKEYTVKDIENLSPAEQKKLFQRYQIKFGREVVTTVGQSILSLYARAIGLTLPVVLFYKCHKYGVYLSPLVATLIIAKHLNFEKIKTAV